MDHTKVDTLVLGIGNILWADEGFGIRVVEALNAEYRLPADVCVMDGGTQGLFLLPWVRNASRLLILDAIDRCLVRHQSALTSGITRPSPMTVSAGSSIWTANRTQTAPTALASCRKIRASS